MGAFSSAVGMGFVLRERAIHPFYIPTNSMAPAVNAGDRILALKETYFDRNPERGELIVYRPAFNRRQLYLKRVIGVAGDKVEWSETGEIRINGSVLPHVPAATGGFSARVKTRGGKGGEFFPIAEACPGEASALRQELLAGKESCQPG